MGVYFIRYTQEEECIGCGACEDICPVGGFPQRQRVVSSFIALM